MITINALNKSYGDKKVLKDIDMSFEEGNIYGVVGENGAGKSTLFKCMVNLERGEGSIEYTKGILKNVTGFLETNPYLLTKITGQEYLQLLCNARQINLQNIPSKNVFDLPLGQYANTYSSGMKKKLALTGILLQENKVFILDEPFNGVDIQSNIMIKEVLLKLKALNKIVILSSHIFSTLIEVCDHLHYLKKGEIVKSAGPNEFALIEEEMKGSGLGARIDKLDLK